MNLPSSKRFLAGLTLAVLLVYVTGAVYRLLRGPWLVAKCLGRWVFFLVTDWFTWVGLLVLLFLWIVTYGP